VFARNNKGLIMKKSILCVVGFAVIAALVCVVCNNNSVDEDKKGAAASFLDGFIDTDVAYYGLTVGINPAGGGTVSRNPNQTRYKAGDSVRVTATVRDGYLFTGWTGASNDTAASVIIIMNGDLTLTANFIPITTTYYTLDVSTLPVGYGSVSRNPNKTVYAAGESVMVTAAANPGYAFVGWSGASNNTTDTVTITMSRDLTLTANFQVGAYTLTLTANPTGGGSVSREPDKKTYSYEDTVTVTATVAPYYRFTGWSGASTDTTAIVKIIMNDSKALTANFIRQYTVTFNANNGSGAVSNAITADSGSAITLPAGDSLTRSGYTFGGWNTDSAGTKTNYSAASSYTFTADTILYAKWTLNTYKVTFNSQGGSAVDSQVVAHGGSVRSPANPTLDDYIFGGWYKESACANSWDFGTDVVTSAITLYAKWNLPYIWVLFYTNWGYDWGYGTTPPNQTVTVGDSIMLPSGDDLTRTGYTFSGWNTAQDGTGTAYEAGSYLKHPGGSGNISLYVMWTLDTYTVEFDSQGGSAIDSQTVEHFGRVTEPTAPTRDNYTFGGWYTDAACTNSNWWDFEMGFVESAMTLYAKWTLNTYTVTFNSQDGSAVNSQNIAHGGKATSPANPTRTGYTFGGWYKEDTYTTQWNFDTDVVTSAITLYAKWNPYTVTFNANGGTVTPTSDTTGQNRKLASLPIPTRDGYTFNGWYTAASGGTVVTENREYSGNYTIYAQWYWVGKGNDINNYKTVTIGTQTWMAENLDYDVEGSKCYDNDQTNCEKYGRLYDWSTAMTACPIGWRLPSLEELVSLLEYLGDDNGLTAGKKLKSTSCNGTDEYGFSALLGGKGYPSNDGRYYFFIDGEGYGDWWTSMSMIVGSPQPSAFNFTMVFNGDHVGGGYMPLGYGLSVRCVRD
jgi:uncharacterized protein (TIGR02145 family)/uncharacterized repeat protein (TIGR02543 family)